MTTLKKEQDLVSLARFVSSGFEGIARKVTLSLIKERRLKPYLGRCYLVQQVSISCLQKSEVSYHLCPHLDLHYMVKGN